MRRQGTRAARVGALGLLAGLLAGAGCSCPLYSVHPVPPDLAESDLEAYRDRVAWALRFAGLAERKNDRAGTYSGGMQRRLNLACALVHDPPVLFLDEPTAGLDPEAARTVRDFVGLLRREGRTIFLTTHNLPEADELCDVVAVFERRLLRMGTPSIVRTAGDARGYLDSVRVLGFVREASADGDRLTIRMDDPDARNPEVVDALSRAGARIRYVEPIRHSLEDVYLRLLGDAGK